MAGILKQQRSLGTLLIERGLISRAQLDQALIEQKRTGEKLGRLLARMGFVRERDIVAVMEGLMVVLFELQGEFFAVESLLVREIIRARPALPLPQAPGWMEGLIHYRSHVVPVLNLRLRLGLQRGESDDRARIIIFEQPGRQVGLLVDEVSSVQQVTSEQLEEAPRGQLGLPELFIYGMARLDQRLVTVLNFEALLASDEAVSVRLAPGARKPA